MDPLFLVRWHMLSFLAISKICVLGAAILFVVPLMFFLIVGVLGRHLSLAIHHDSWLATTNIKVIRKLSKRFLI
jgi:hypothetical protein